MPSALVIEIQKRAKAKEGASMDDEESEDSGAEGVEAIKDSAVADLVAALGLSTDEVDVDAVKGALSDFAEACASTPSGYGKD